MAQGGAGVTGTDEAGGTGSPQEGLQACPFPPQDRQQPSMGTQVSLS